MTGSAKPEADRLLAAIQKEQHRAGRGRLKVFFGMAPGVGKTFAMLEAARAAQAAGIDVVAGYIESHKRPETEALLKGLAIIPPRRAEYLGVAMTELDLDAVLARRSQLVLVDEFAHTNAPGSRHPKRFQDILEILDAGLDVFTTLNVQHVESRAEAVRQITGVTIRETVPDTALDGATIELVDLPPDELRARLAAGKVYLPEAARAAQDNFFRTGNLAALRELSLRFAAEQDVLAYRQAQGVADPWKSGQRLLVAVSSSPTSAALVRWTRRLAGELQAPWLAVYVEQPRPLSGAEQGRLAKHLALARELGAQIIHTSDDEVARGILRVAREHNITQIVVGKPATSSPWQWARGGSLLNRLVRDSGNIDVHTIRAEGGTPLFRRPFAGRFDGDVRSYLVALQVVALTTGLNALLQQWLGYQSLALIYLFSVLLLAMFVGRGPGLVAASLTALSWNFFFTEPRFDFHINGSGDVMMFSTYFVVALAMGHLAARLRAQQAAERRREQRATTLYLITRELAQATDFADLLAIIIREAGKAAEARVALSLPEDGPEKTLTPYFASTWSMPEKEQSVAAWAFQQARPAGRGTDTLPLAEGLHLPLLAGTGPVGVIGLCFQEDKILTPDQRDLLDTIVRQIALVLDRQRLRDAEQEAKLVIESERLSKTLLNSISHEIRTPIAAITSAVSSLSEVPAATLNNLQVTLLGEIGEASDRLNRLVANLLNMTRLESGHVKPRLDWCDIADLIQATIRSVEKEINAHPLTTAIAANLPLLRLDFILMQQALGNLLLNVSIHTPAGTAIRVSAAVEGKVVTLRVSDEGPGIPPASLPFLFEKFYRAPQAPAGGTGLGLAIVKGFVEAQGGQVSAANRPQGGAEFTIRLPVRDSPPISPETGPNQLNG